MRIFASSPSALKQVFGFFGETGHIVSLVGGGGKTTLMYFMAQTCAREGKKVLVTTTTHIFAPAREYYADSAESVRNLWAQGRFAVVGIPVPEKGKLKMPDPQMLDRLLEEADVAFIEADGSKHCPIKVPREGEPVFVPQSDLVIAVMGLSALGKPLHECCFGLLGATQLLDVAADHILTEEDAAKILSSERGSRKDVLQRRFCVVLNQCDDGPRRRSANEIAARLREYGIDQVVMTAFDPEERVKYDQMSNGLGKRK
ncbi:MAG: putative selenium-dependent hydroxylase accessory protein YqeC [Oscillospiraceae bacterium]|nr:putative selenium-dependent hydroxylase accessory protein YqeC [Oscillospiraceae bacterium]